MPMINRANTTWQGDLTKGSGRVNSESGTVRDAQVSWGRRTEGQGEGTNPEELIAAAHSACFSMAFAARLAKNGTPPTRLDVSCAVTFDKVAAGFAIVSSELTVRGEVPGIDEAKFKTIAEDAKENCPVSAALKGNVRLSVDASLA